MDPIEHASYVDNGRHVLALVGELDLSSAPALRRLLARWLLDVGDRPAVLDLTGVRFIDSRGARAIVQAQTQGHPAAPPIEVRGASATAKRLLEIIRIADLHRRDPR